MADVKQMKDKELSKRYNKKTGFKSMQLNEKYTF